MLRDHALEHSAALNSSHYSIGGTVPTQADAVGFGVGACAFVEPPATGQVNVVMVSPAYLPVVATRALPRTLVVEGEVAKPKPPWKLEESIFAPRRRDCASKVFFVSQQLHKRAFLNDWGLCKKFPRIVKDDSLKQVKEVFRRHFYELSQVF